MSKVNILAQLEDSLRNFIIDEYMGDPREKVYFNPFKYKGLTIVIDPVRRGPIPQFIVQIAMLEAEISIETGKKVSGGLGVTDEHMIERWLERGSNRNMMLAAWEGRSNFEDKILKIRPFDME